MSVPDETFDLVELSKRAGVTPRTVRYYVQQGLLPSPGARGPAARYDAAHLMRIRLIRRLQQEHLPLAEIRFRLERLEDDEVRAALAAPEETPPSSALDYVRQVLSGGAPVTRATMAMSAPAPEAMVAEPARPASRQRLAEESSPVPKEFTGREQRSQWERIALAPDVELHVRRPLSRAQNRLVERLIELARRALEEDAP
jgi:DNA-binding transcriptional MerR regulator